VSPDAKPLGEPTLEGVGNRPQQLMYIGALLSPAHGRNNNKPEGQTAKHDHRRSVFTLLGLATRPSAFMENYNILLNPPRVFRHAAAWRPESRLKLKD